MVDTANPDLITARELSQWLRLGLRQTYSLIESGAVPGVTRLHGRSIRISRHAVAEWLALESEDSHDERRELLRLLDQAQPLIEALQPIFASLVSNMNAIREHQAHNEAAQHSRSAASVNGATPEGSLREIEEVPSWKAPPPS